MPRTAAKAIVDATFAVWRLHEVRSDPGELTQAFLLDYKRRLSEIAERVFAVERLVDEQLRAAFPMHGRSARTAPDSSRVSKLRDDRIFDGRLDGRDDGMLDPLRAARDELEPSRAELLAAVDEISPRSLNDARMRLLFAVSFAAQLQTLRNLVRAHARKANPGRAAEADPELLRLERSADNDAAWSALAKEALAKAVEDRELEERHEGRSLGSLADLPPYDEQTQRAHFRAALGFDAALIPDIPSAFLLDAIGERTLPRKKASEPVLRDLGLREGYLEWEFIRAFLDRFAGKLQTRAPERADKDLWARFRKAPAFESARKRLSSPEVRASLGLLSAREEQEGHDDLLRRQEELLRRQQELKAQQDAQKTRHRRRRQTRPAAAALRAVRGRVSARLRAQRGSSKKSS